MARIRKKPAKADDEWYEPEPVIGMVGAYMSNQVYRPDEKVKNIRVVGFVRPTARKDAKPRRRR